jgi:ribosomal-protein-alanine N-acetyltransferase
MADLQAICLIEDASFSDPYPRRLLKRLLDHVGNNFLVAERGDGKLFGYCVASMQGRLAHLISIAVLSEGRRKGVATALLQNLVDHMKVLGVDELWLEVKRDNRDAIRLYEKLGFQGVMILENYYSDGSSALRMRTGFKNQLVKAEREAG